jgi:uncharacterized protein YxeA
MKKEAIFLIIVAFILLGLGLYLIYLINSDGGKCVNNPQDYFYKQLTNANKPNEVSCQCLIMTKPQTTTYEFNSKGTKIFQGNNFIP